MQQKHTNRRKDILFILISSFIVVVAWISFNIYHIWITSTVSETIQPQLAPINPVFDPVTIQDLKKREHIDPLFNKQQSTTHTSESTASGAAIPTQASNAAQIAPINVSGSGLQGQ
ncbi:MAG: hypothetical protein ACR2LN_01530 [Candidatus Levyibacteriota bacterium]